MANFLGNLGAVFRGQQDYQTYLQEQASAKVRLEADQAKLAEIKDLTAEAKKQRERQGTVDQTTLDFLASIGGGQGIPPPPPQQPPPQQQPPAPGQQSVPMIQPGQMPQGGPPQRQMPPQQQGPQEMPQGAPTAPQLPPGGPQMRQGGQHGPQMSPQGVPPYQTVAGGPQQQQQPQGIPAPPQQPQGAPPPNSMTLQDAAKFIKSRGITDPVAGMQILDKLTPYLNNEAKQEAATYKLQLEYSQKKSALDEQIRAHDLASEDRKLSIEERKRAAAESTALKAQLGLLNVGVRQQGLQLRRAELDQKIKSGAGLTPEDHEFMAEQILAGQKDVLVGLGRNPKDIVGVRSAVTRLAKERGIKGNELATATAEFEGLKAGERALGTRTANVSLAANEAKIFAENALEASNKVKRTEYPDLNRIILAGQKGVGNKEVVELGAYTNSLINAYARAVSPSGAPTVSDKDHAREILEKGFSKGQYAAAVGVILKEIEGAEKAPAQSKQQLKDLANAGRKTGPAAAPAVPSGWKVETQ